MQYFTTFLSRRNVPLILQHLPDINQPLLTIENWESWEESSIYAVYHDGLVESILLNKSLSIIYYNLKEIYNQSPFKNGVWDLNFIAQLEEKLEIEWDQTSLDVLYGRYHYVYAKL